MVTAILASSRLVTGRLDLGDQRLSDALNNALQSVLHLSDATLGWLGNPAVQGPFGETLIPKHQVALIYEHDERSLSRQKRLYAYVEKQAAELLLIVAGLRVQGRAYSTSEFDTVNLHRLIATADDKFVPMTNATMALDIEGTKSIELGSAMVNLRHIQFAARQPEKDS